MRSFPTSFTATAWAVTARSAWIAVATTFAIAAAGCTATTCPPGTGKQGNRCYKLETSTDDSVEQPAAPSGEVTSGAASLEPAATGPGMGTMATTSAGNGSPPASNGAAGAANPGMPQAPALLDAGVPSNPGTGSAGEPAQGAAPMSSAAHDAGLPAPAGEETPSCEPQPESCNGADDDCDGTIDEQLTMECGTSGNPPCRLGTMNCVGGTWGECVGAVEPGEEVCDAQSVDEDCDGMQNEGCECKQGDMRPCMARSGICEPGTQTCVDGRWDTRCSGEVPGTPEVCDGQDNDCDGVQDNGRLCEAGSSCRGTEGCQSDASTGTIRAALRTSGGQYITFTNGGGLAGGTTSVHTDATNPGAWETFEIEWVGTDYKQLALRTANRNYVTAVSGGGVGGPNDATSPIHTDSNRISAWEQLTLNITGDRVTIRRGAFYLTAVGGGGRSGGGQAIHTDGSTRGAWEIFTLAEY